MTTPAQNGENERKANPHFERFIKAIPKGTDSVAGILRVHLLAEYYLDQIIITRLKRGDIITDAKFQFWEKIIIIEALDIVSKEILDSLKKLNVVRNSCSHVLEYCITESDIDKIGNPFGKKYQDYKTKLGPDTSKLLQQTLAILMSRLSAKVETFMRQSQ